jgi:hypothetical protein
MSFGDDFKKYNPKTFDAIPLHKPKATREIERKGESITVKIGKRPLHPAWTTMRYDSKKVVAQCIADKRNMGIRPRPDQMIIDIDPRNGGNEGWADLCETLGTDFDPTDFPCVTTGSGGLHLYMAKPPELKLRDTIEGHPGVEFKGAGRQVLAAGCLHPDTGKPYVFTPGHPDINTLPPAPKALLRLIKRAPRPKTANPGGHVTNHRLAMSLEGLNPEDFRDHDEWLQLLFACHHATGGEGRHEFIEWSTRDPEYAEHAEIIGRRWDSAHADRDDGVTVASLNRHLAKRKRNDLLLPTKSAKKDFAEDGLKFVNEEKGAATGREQRDKRRKEESDSWGAEFDESGDPDDPERSEFEGDDNPEMYTLEGMSRLEELNNEWALAIDGGTLRIMREQEDRGFEGRKYWTRLHPQDFKTRFCNERLERDTSGLSRNAAETIQLGQAWLEWPGRRSYDSVFFEPTDKTSDDALNLWKGFALQPSKEGKWDLLEQLMFENLCDGNAEHFEYLLNWLTRMIQMPQDVGHVAVVFRGAEGVGKGTLGNATANLIGHTHAIALASPEQITGRFNSHLQQTLFLFADEAIRPGDKAAEARLKSLVTEPTIAIEAKGKDIVQAKNYVHLMMASNNLWVIPASVEARRFFMLDVNTGRQGDKDFFTKLRAQLYDNHKQGLRRMLYDLQARTLPADFHPSKRPTTKALLEQKLLSQGPLARYLYDSLNEGRYPFVTFERKGGGGIAVFTETFRESFILWQRDNNINPGTSARASNRFLMAELRHMIPSVRTDQRHPVNTEVHEIEVGTDGRAWCIHLPTINQARIEFSKWIESPIDWLPLPGVALPTADEVTEFG